MPVDPRRRQKRIAQKAAWRKAQVAKKQRTERSRSGASFRAKMAALHPVHECYVHAGIFKSGIGHVLVSRRIGSQVAVGFFLLDVYCLGVKDAAFGLKSMAQYEALIERMRTTEDLTEIEPACARKLIVGAVAYARGLGFKPHKDYYGAALILGTIDPDECPKTFEYGKDGEPLYVSGPFDSQARINLICKTLERTCGSDGFHYIVGLSEPEEDLDWVDEENGLDEAVGDEESEDDS